jgi:hypothetical protein
MVTVARVADPVMAAELRRRAAEAFGLPEAVLAEELAARARPRRADPTDPTDPSDQTVGRGLTRRQKAERELAWALAVHPAGLSGAAAALGDFAAVSDPAAAEFLTAARKVYENLGELNIEELATALSGPEAVSLAADIASRLGRTKPADPAGAVLQVLADLSRIDLEKEFSALGEEIRAAAPDRQVAIADRIAAIKRQIHRLQQPAGRAAAAAQSKLPEG